MKNKLYSVALALLMTGAKTIFCAATDDAASNLIYFYPGQEEKSLIWGTEEKTLQAAIIDTPARTDSLEKDLEFIKWTLASRTDAPQIKLEDNILTLKQKDKTFATLASLFIENNSKLQSEKPLRRFILLAPSLSEQDREDTESFVNNRDLTLSITEIAELLLSSDTAHAFALINIAHFLEQKHGIDWQEKLPIAHYKTKNYTKNELEKIKKKEAFIKAGTIGLAATGSAILASIALNKKDCAIQ